MFSMSQIVEPPASPAISRKVKQLINKALEGVDVKEGLSRPVPSLASTHAFKKEVAAKCQESLIEASSIQGRSSERLVKDDLSFCLVASSY